MQLMVNDKIINLKVCNNFFSRLIGNMFTKNIKPLVFNHCNSIHTFFMKKNIDVLMFDKNKKHLKTYENLRPWKIIFPKKNTYYIVELAAKTIKGNDLIILK